MHPLVRAFYVTVKALKSKTSFLVVCTAYRKEVVFFLKIAVKIVGVNIANHETQLTELTVLATIKLEEKQ